MDFKMKLEDHGDHRMTVTGKKVLNYNFFCIVFLDDIKADFMECKSFLPEFNPTQIYVAGSGNSVHLREIKVSQRER